MIEILQGLYVEVDTSAISMPFLNDDGKDSVVGLLVIRK